jgi:hypothetical protein
LAWIFQPVRSLPLKGVVGSVAAMDVAGAEVVAGSAARVRVGRRQRVRAARKFFIGRFLVRWRCV